MLFQRPLSFVGACDGYHLRSGKFGSCDWDKVGTPEETKAVPMSDYMTYDEIKLAALLQLSSPTMPINRSVELCSREK